MLINATEKVLGEAAEALSACQDCIETRFPDAWFAVSASGEKIHISFGYYQFEISPTCKYSLARQVNSGFSCILPWTRRDLMRQQPGSGSHHFPAWLFYADCFIADWLSRSGALAKIQQCEHQNLYEKHVETPRACSFEFRSDHLRSSFDGTIYCGAIAGTIRIDGVPTTTITRNVLRIEGVTIPATKLQAYQRDIEQGRLRLEDIMCHPALADSTATVHSIRSAEKVLEVFLHPGVRTLGPVPAEALALAAKDCDPGEPWNISPNEADRLRAIR